jgi:hypothetical protein
MKLEPKEFAQALTNAITPKDMQPLVDSDIVMPEITPEFAWLLAKLCKHARLRMRNNAALNNWFNAAFPHLLFKQVPKERINRRTGLRETYEGLQITWRNNTTGIVHMEEGDDDE